VNPGITLSWASELYCDAVDAINRAGITDSDDDALALFQTVWSSAHPFTAPPPHTTAAVGEFEALVHRRCAGVPLAHLTGTVRFMGLDLEVEPGVFIPRERTTLDLARHSIAVATGLAAVLDRPVRVADVGTGCGNLAVAVLETLGDRATVVATDIAPAAIAVAGRNLARFGCADRARLVCTDVLDGVPGPFDMVIANPPYLTRPETNARWSELRREPVQAIDGNGEDGLAVARRVIDAAHGRLDPAGILLLELATSQMHRAAAVAARRFVEVDLVHNGSGIPRVLLARKPLGA
jgi:release factor glutamine methyltransferase